tara:strand:+ start:163 stop:594 length:432 start_codon:yes stop_codon:yes gene_type:complete
MKTVFFTLIVLATTKLWAQQTPQIRVCNISNGYFQALDLAAPVNDNVGFCRYDKVLFGAISALKALDGILTDASRSFIATDSAVYSSCQDAGAIRVNAQQNRRMDRVCYFADGSVISELSLVEGWNSTINRKLRDFLEATGVK